MRIMNSLSIHLVLPLGVKSTVHLGGKGTALSPEVTRIIFMRKPWGSRGSIVATGVIIDHAGGHGNGDEAEQEEGVRRLHLE